MYGAARVRFVDISDTFALPPSVLVAQWAAYKAKLPELDVDAIKADYEKVLKSIPAIPYDASADKAAHETKEKVRGRLARIPPRSSLFQSGKTTCRARLMLFFFFFFFSLQAWEGFSKYCTEKVAELKLLAAEQADHKLHRWYRRSRIWQRFPGLYEELHNKARGTWDRELWGNVSRSSAPQVMCR